MVRYANFSGAEENFWSRMTISNCNRTIYDRKESDCSSYVHENLPYEEMYTQENEIFINFESNEKFCNNNCWWELDFSMIEIVQGESTNILSDENFGIKDSWQNRTSYTYHSIQNIKLFFAMDLWDRFRHPNANSIFYIYYSSNLTNFASAEFYTGNFSSGEYSFDKEITIFYVGLLNSNDAGFVTAYFRTVEDETNNCNEESLIFVQDSANVSISGIGHDYCMLYVAVARVNNFVPTLTINSDAIWYTGNSSVKVAAGYNDTFILYEFDHLTANIYGYLLRYEANLSSVSHAKKDLWIILLSVGVFLFILLLVISIFIIYTKRQKKHFVQLYDILKEMYLTPDDLEALKKMTDEFEIDIKKLAIDFVDPIGHGFSANVYRGRFNGPSPLHLKSKTIETQKFCDCEVAVKMPNDFGQNEAENLFKEINAMKTIGYHEHIISILGWCKYNAKPCLVFELAQSDLLKFVRDLKSKEDTVSMRLFLSILWQAADGMHCISSKGLIHRDVAARNVLLGANYVAKISDFGLCCQQGDNFIYQASLTKKLPMKWLSLEALQSRTFSEKSDVWAFGVLMYEVFSLGKVPYELMNNMEMLDYLKEGQRLEAPEFSNETIYNLMRDCWEEEPTKRPNFGGTLQKLREMIEEQTDSYGYLS